VNTTDDTGLPKPLLWRQSMVRKGLILKGGPVPAYKRSRYRFTIVPWSQAECQVKGRYISWSEIQIHDSNYTPWWPSLDWTISMIYQAGRPHVAMNAPAAGENHQLNAHVSLAEPLDTKGKLVRGSPSLPTAPPFPFHRASFSRLFANMKFMT